MRDIFQDIQRLWRTDGPRALLARGASVGLVANLVGAVLGYGQHVLLARVMGPASYGIFAYVPSWLDLLLLLGLFGMAPTVVRFASAYRSEQRLGAIRGLLRFADRVAMGGSVTAAAALVAVILLIPSATLARIAEDPDDLARAFLIGAVALPFIALAKLRTDAIRAFDGAALSLSLEGVFRPALMIVLVLAAVSWIDGPLTGSVGLALYAASFVALFGVASWLLRARQPSGLRRTPPEYESRLWLDMAVPSLFLAGAQILVSNTDRILVGTLLGTEEAGVYGAALRTAQLITFGLVAVNAALAPLTASLHASGNLRELQRVLTLGAWGVFAWSLVAGIGLLAFGGTLLQLFGPAFESGFPSLGVLAVAKVVNASCGSVGVVLGMTGHQRQVARIFAGAALLNVVLDLLLIPRLGMVGAAIGTGVSMAAWNVTLLVLVRRVLGLNPSVFGRLRRDPGDGPAPRN